MSRGLPALAAVLVTALAVAQDPLRGRVVDDDGRPIAGVAVCRVTWDVPFVTQELAKQAVARSNERGEFTVPGGIDDRGRLLLVAPGRMHMEVGDAWVRMLPVVLPRGHTLSGRVRDAEGQPIAGVCVEATDLVDTLDFLEAWEDHESAPCARTAVLTDDKGNFVLTGTCDTAARVSAGGQEWDKVTLGPVCALDPLDFVLERKAAAAAPVREVVDRPVLVRAVDPDGKAVASFKATVSLGVERNPTPRSEARTLRRFAGSAVASVDGEVTTSLRSLKGFGVSVFVVADGWAMASGEGQGDAPQVTVRLEPECRISGKVVDGATGAPIAGARVWALGNKGRGPDRGRERLEEYAPGSFAVTSGEDGGFMLRQQPPGSRGVYVIAEGYHDNRRQSIELGQAASQEVRVDMECRRVLRGSLRAPLPPFFAGVRLTNERSPSMIGFGGERRFQGCVPLHPDGTFRILDLEDGDYEAQLILLRPGRQGLADTVSLGKVEIRPDTKDLVLETADVLPGLVSGRITGNVPRQRLAVLSVQASPGRPYYMFLHYEGPLAPVSIDGSYAMREPAGSRRLVVIDLWTGAMLSRGEAVTVAAGGTRTVNLRVEAVPVTFRLLGEPTANDYCIEFVPQDAHWPKGIGRIGDRHRGVLDSYTTHMGAKLMRGQLTGTFWLPAASCELQLRLVREGYRKEVLEQRQIDASRRDEREVVFDPRR